MLILILSGAFLAGLATASLDKRAFVPPASWCLQTSNLTSLSGCIAMNSYLDQCAALDTNQSRINCYCQQEMLSDYYEYAATYLYPYSPFIRANDTNQYHRCESDVILCLGSPMFDSSFQSLISAWHTSCTSLLTTLTFTPSTLPLSTLTSTYDFGACYSLALSCTSANYETDLCSTSYLPAETTEYLSCVCAESVYSLFSECQYDGNVSCSATPAAKSNILGWSFCSYFRPGAVSFFLFVRLEWGERNGETDVVRCSLRFRRRTFLRCYRG
jgi:hypothetical protein